jgi:hypothetical protein
MGWVTVTSACAGCGRLFHYNPHRVPSLRVNGAREPICAACVERVNPARVAKGLAPIVPLPGAYEPIDERDLVLDPWGD